ATCVSPRYNGPIAINDNQGAAHTTQQVNEWRNEDAQAKRRQRACKGCSALRSSDCNSVGPIYLCMKVRRKVRGVATTWWDIWHKEWSNGMMIPVENANSIRVRRKPSAADPGTPSVPRAPRTPASKKKRKTTT
ncbi:hypothetical protein JG688_00017612, partial [Phytophthora aleatoria]